MSTKELEFAIKLGAKIPVEIIKIINKYNDVLDKMSDEEKTVIVKLIQDTFILGAEIGVEIMNEFSEVE